MVGPTCFEVRKSNVNMNWKFSPSCLPENVW